MGNRRQNFVLFAALLGLFLPFLGCDSASNPVAPAGTVLTVTATPTKITPTGEASSIVVTGFRPDGNALNPGTQIILATDLGTLGATTVTIGDNGRATTSLVGDGRTGAATVTATLASGGDASGTATVTVEALVPTITLFANPETVGVGGRSDITIIARDNNNFPLSAGERIRLVAENGRMTDQEVFTDDNGEAFSRFIAGDRSETGQVTAFLGNNDASTSTVSITIVDAPDSFNLQVSTSRVSASSVATVDVEVVVLDTRSSPLPNATVVLGTEPNVGGTFSNGEVQVTGSSGAVNSTLTIPQGNLTAGVPFLITAEVSGEGITLPLQSRTIQVDP